MDKKGIVEAIKNTLEQEELSAQNRIALENAKSEIENSKKIDEVKNVLIDLITKLFISDFDKFLDLFN